MPPSPSSTLGDSSKNSPSHNPPSTATVNSPTPKRKNAFEELMSRRPTTAEEPATPKRPRPFLSSIARPFAGRNGLLEYIQTPESIHGSRVITYDDKWVLIHDLFPKASLHLLLLPRDPQYYSMHPLKAFEDPVFLASAKEKLVEVKAIAASELRRLHGALSVQDRARNEALDAEDPPPTLPAGRDWSKELMMGIHANPSMNHLHIHVISRDLHSDYLRHRKHYLSFNTDFLCKVDEMPLTEGEQEVRRGSAQEILHGDMLCWRCGKNFGNKMKELKSHLDTEYEEWRRE